MPKRATANKNIVFTEAKVKDERPIDIQIGTIYEPSCETPNTEFRDLPHNIFDDDLYDLNPATIKKDKDIKK